MKKELVKQINKQIANLGVGYVKFHNLHWNVVGSQFKPVHEYLEALYDSITSSFDEVAELLKIHGEYPVASMKEFLQISEIKELDSKDVHFVDALKIALEDLTVIKEQALKIRSLAVEEDIIGVIDSMERIITSIEKESWFIKTMLI